MFVMRLPQSIIDKLIKQDIIQPPSLQTISKEELGEPIKVQRPVFELSINNNYFKEENKNE